MRKPAKKLGKRCKGMTITKNKNISKKLAMML
jgi:hypothetical protein